MATLLLYALNVLCTVIGIAGTIWYIQVRIAASRKYKTMLDADTTKDRAPLEAYWAADRQQKRVASVIMVSFAASIFLPGLLVWLGADQAGWLPFLAKIVSAFAMASVGVTASIMNGRDFDARLERRYRY